MNKDEKKELYFLISVLSNIILFDCVLFGFTIFDLLSMLLISASVGLFITLFEIAFFHIKQFIDERKNNKYE